MEEVEKNKSFNNSGQFYKPVPLNETNSTRNQLNGLCFAGKRDHVAEKNTAKTEISANLQNGEHDQGDNASLDGNEIKISDTNQNGHDSKLYADKSEKDSQSLLFFEKARNSLKLKELASKICSSPDKKTESEITAIQTDDESSITHKPDETLKYIGKVQLDGHESEQEKHKSECDSNAIDKNTNENGTHQKNCMDDGVQKVDTKDSFENQNEDELLKPNIDEVAHMEIGSDNEDDLLRMSPHGEQSVEVDGSKTKPVIEIEELDNADEVNNSNCESDIEKSTEIIQTASTVLSESDLPECNTIQKDKDISDVDMDCINLDEDDEDASSSKKVDNQNNAKASNSISEDVIGTEKLDDISAINKKTCDDIRETNHKIENIEHIEISPEKSPKALKSVISDDMKDHDDGEDDDVIFEGESKVQNEDGNGRENVTNATNTDESGAINDQIDKNEVESVETVSVIKDDDDVIFEGESKVKSNFENVIEKVTNAAIDDGSEADNYQNKIKHLETVKENQTVDVKNDDVVICEQETKNVVEENPEKKDILKESSSENRKRPAEAFAISDSKRTKVELENYNNVSKEEPASIDLIDSDEEMDTSQPVTNYEPNLVDNEIKKPTKEDKNMITLTGQELETLVRQKVKAYLASQRDNLYAQLSQKVKDLQSNNDLWKKQIKDLQLKINDVTILQQKHEKRKAHTAALRQITTRSVGVQVDDGRTSSSKNKLASPQPLANGSPKSAAKPAQLVTSPVVTAPPGANGMIRLPIPQSSIAPPVLAAPILTQQPQIVTSDYKTPTVKSLLGTTRTQPTISSAPPTIVSSSPTVVTVQYPQRVVTHAPTLTTSANVIKLPLGSSPTTTKVVTKANGTSKIIDLTDDEPRMLVSIPQGMSSTATTMRGIPVLSQGQQLVRANFPNTTGTFQLVLGPGTPPIRPGTIVTGLPQTLIQSLPQSSANVTNHNSQNNQPIITTVVNRSVPQLQTTNTAQKVAQPQTHPAPFPQIVPQKLAPKLLPPKPSLKVARVNQGIVLSWTMIQVDNMAGIQSYQLFAYQETNTPPNSSLWKKVGDVKALPLPMACTLTQFQVGNKYHFAVRAMDVFGRVSDYSDPSSLHMVDGKPAEKNS